MGIFRNVSGIFITLCNTGIFKSLVYLEPWYIQNLGHIQSSVKHLRWSVMRKQLKDCNCFRNINFSRFLRYEINIMNFLNIGLIFTPEVIILCKKVWESGGLRAVDFDIPFTTTAFHQSKRTAIWKSRHWHKKFYRAYLNFRKLLQFFGNFWKHLKWNPFRYTCRPSWKFSTKLLRAGIWQRKSASVCFCQKGSSQLTLPLKFS